MKQMDWINDLLLICLYCYTKFQYFFIKWMGYFFNEESDSIEENLFTRYKFFL